MDDQQDVEGVRFQWIRYAGGIDNLDASIPLALGFIDSADEWGLVCSEQDRGAWIEADEFSTMALVRALRMIEEWSESKTEGDYNPNSRESSLRRKVQRKLESMKEDPSLMILLSPGHWKIKSEEYKNYCRMRFEMSKKMDDSWSFQKESSSWSEVESKRTKLRPTPPTFARSATYQRAWESHITGRRERTGDDFAEKLQRQQTMDKLERLQRQIWVTQKDRYYRSENLITEFGKNDLEYAKKREQEYHNSDRFRWERKLNRRFKRLTRGKLKNPEERVWPLKSIPEPDRDEEGKFVISSKRKKMRWRIHLSILKIMVERHGRWSLSFAQQGELSGVTRKWITRESISNALKEDGEGKTEGRISQVLGDLVGLGAIDKKSDEDDGRIKLYRAKQEFCRNNIEENRENALSSFELDKMRNVLAHHTEADEKSLDKITKMIDEIKDTLDA